MQVGCEPGSVGRRARAVVADFVNHVFLQRGVAGCLLEERADSSGFPHVRGAPEVDGRNARGSLQAQVEPPLLSVFLREQERGTERERERERERDSTDHRVNG